MQRFLLLLSSLFLFAEHTSGQPVNHIYTDYGTFFSSGVTNLNTTTPNNVNNLVGFKVGSTIYSTGVNNDLLDANNITYTTSNWQALPVRAISGTPTTSTYVGLGSNYGGVPHTSASPALTRSMAYYLADGINGLDMGTGVYNIPVSANTYAVDEFQISRINDGVPDIIATQIGDYPTTGVDSFKFVDAAGGTVGNAIALNFSSVDPVANFRWAFYSANQNPMPYAASQPGGANSTRAIRLQSWDLSAFGINASNVGFIVSFVHKLSGNSDQAFMAYNTTTFRALSVIDPGCNAADSASLWLQANNGTNAVNNNDKVASWKDHSSSALPIGQSNNLNRPTFKDGSNAGFNFNPYLDFNNGNMLDATNSPFATTSDPMTIFIVGRATATSGNNKILGFSRNGTDYGSAARGDFPAINFNASGSVELTNGGLNVSTASITDNRTGIWQLNKANNTTANWRHNGVSAGNATIAALTQGRYFTHIGDMAPGNDNSDFDLAELIVFRKNISVAQREKVETYLGVKYGITLASNYVSGSGLQVWDYSNNLYNNRIAGIGREDCQGLSQRQSISAIDSAIKLTIGVNTIATSNKANLSSIANEQYMIWGDNNGALTLTNEIQAKNLCLRSSDRTWRVQRTGDYISLQPMQITMNVAAISWNEPAYTASAANYYLLVDRNGNGIFDDAVDTAIQAASLSAGIATFNNVRWDIDESGTDYFKIAVKRAELPVLNAIAGNNIVNVASTITLTTNSSPAGTWTSSNPLIASVDATGVVTGVTAGSTTISYTESSATNCSSTVNHLVTVTTPLPLSLLDFTLTKQHPNAALLEWITAEEKNLAYFGIEQSEDGSVFKTIDRVAAKNTSTKNSYTFVDEHVQSDKTFYRLKMTDIDGAYRYSPVRMLVNKTSNVLDVLQLYPNPAKDKVMLSFNSSSEESLLISITKIDGSKAKPAMKQSLKKGANNFSLDISSLQPGVYMLHYTTEKSNKTSSIRLVKLGA